MQLGEANFEHPNLVFVADQDGSYATTLQDRIWIPRELSDSIKRSRSGSQLAGFRPFLPVVA